MNWVQFHQRSQDLASAAHAARAAGRDDYALELFSKAADFEVDAVKSLVLGEKPRTYGVIAVSAAALLYKAGRKKESESFSHSCLSAAGLPDFAVDELRELLQVIWNEYAQDDAGVSFAGGQITVSVDGGEVVRGGAPLDLIVEKVQTIQNIFYRTTEFLKNMPLRRRGAATKEIQGMCRPWLFQSVPGSYQFSVALQTPPQGDLFEENGLDPELVSSTFMAVLEAAASDPQNQLKGLVPDEEYRSTFLKLARNLAPTGKKFTSLEVRSSSERAPVFLSKESRISMTKAIRDGHDIEGKEKFEVLELKGVLRAVHLEKDWLELASDSGLIHISGVGETIDDVIGPMVNHHVVVHAIKGPKGFRFSDIEFDGDA
jgi:hypothetical protein